jgi:hypothetical protein
VPTFNAPQLSIAPAIGIALVVGYMTHPIEAEKKREEEVMGFGEVIIHDAFMAILRPSLALIVGWVIHLFM